MVVMNVPQLVHQVVASCLHLLVMWHCRYLFTNSMTPSEPLSKSMFQYFLGEFIELACVFLGCVSILILTLRVIGWRTLTRLVAINFA